MSMTARALGVSLTYLVTRATSCQLSRIVLSRRTLNTFGPRPFSSHNSVSVQLLWGREGQSRI